jgi:hypothetical protein
MQHREILIIAVTLFLTVVGWVVSDLYHVSVTQQVSEVDPRFAQPLDIRVPVEIFDTIEKKQP